MSSRRNGDLVAVAALAALCAVLAATLPADLVAARLLPALALVLALPGYALTAALLPPAALRAAERTLLAVALSIAATILGALALHLASIGLEAGPWAGLLAGVTALAAGAAAARGHGRALGRLSPGLRGLEIAAVAAALALAGGAFALGLTPFGPPADTRGYTALWLVPRAADTIEVGVRSGQLRRASYTVNLLVAGELTYRYGPIRLEPGEQWTALASVRRRSRAPVIEAVLRRVAAPAVVFRRAVLRNGRVVPRPARRRPLCDGSHPLLGAGGCYRVVVRGKRAWRFYRAGAKVRIRRSAR